VRQANFDQSSASLVHVMELMRLALVYCHLLACCVALGLILKSDLAMLRQLLQDPGKPAYGAQEMQELKATVSTALLILWITGSALIWLDVVHEGWRILTNPKLQAKIIVVLVLSFNGWLLHRMVLPACRQAGSLAHLPQPQYLLALFSGTVSGVSWLYALLLGAGHVLSWQYTLLQLLAAYPVLIAAGTAGLLFLLRRHAPSSTTGAATRAGSPATRMPRRSTARL
jgi:hypothetical protein